MSTHTHLLGGYLCCLSSTAEQEIYKTPRVYLFITNLSNLLTLTLSVNFVATLAVATDVACFLFQAVQWQASIRKVVRSIHVYHLWSWSLSFRAEIQLWMWLAFFQRCPNSRHCLFQQRYVQRCLLTYASSLDIWMRL